MSFFIGDSCFRIADGGADPPSVPSSTPACKTIDGTATTAIAAATALAPPAAFAAGNGAGGVTGPAFYVHGDLYRTVATPTDISGTRAPANSFDTVHDVAGQPERGDRGTRRPGLQRRPLDGPAGGRSRRTHASHVTRREWAVMQL